MQALDFEEILDKICKETGKSSEEIRELVADKKAKFSGLLTDTGAAFMVAKEQGLQLDSNASFSEKKKISDLVEGMKNVDVLGRVKQVFSEREFEKDGKTGKLCDLILEDDSGDCRVTVWNKQVGELDRVRKGDFVLLKNAYCSSFREKIQLNIGFAGQVIFNPNERVEGLQELEVLEKKLGELDEGMDNVDVLCRVLQIYPLKSFEKEERRGKVINFLVGDGSKNLRAAAWNDLAEKVNALNEGSLLKVEGAYVKKGLQDLELNLGWSARIVVNPEGGDDIPLLDELREEKFERKAINELSIYDKNVEISGRIVGVRKGKLHYLVCPKCNKKVQELGEGFTCENCGEVQEPGVNPVITIVVDDGKGIIQTTFFGRQAEKIIGRNAEKLGKELKEKEAEQLVKEIEEKVTGREIVTAGNVQENSLNPDETEFIGREIRELGEEISPEIYPQKV